MPSSSDTVADPALNSTAACGAGIPLPIVRLNRALLLCGVIAGMALRQPLFTTALFALLLPTALWGQRASLISRVGRFLLAASIARATETEDPRLMRFNNSIATVLLGGAQVAFAFHRNAAGWVLCGMVALAAAVALAGYCVGCTLYYQCRRLYKARRGIHSIGI